LRKLTRESEPESYIKMMLRAQAFSTSIIAYEYAPMQKYLTECNAFEHDDSAKLSFVL
jgi:hypothetical protein